MHFASAAARRTLVALCLWLFAGTACADVSGITVAVLDGDTIEVLVDRRPVRVRLSEIDAPERRQAFGSRSRSALAAMVYRQRVHVRDVGRDRHGRMLGVVSIDGRSINRAMIVQGMAWAYRAYVVDRSLLDAEATARAQRRGLWADPHPAPPWSWRRLNASTRS